MPQLICILDKEYVCKTAKQDILQKEAGDTSRHQTTAVQESPYNLTLLGRCSVIPKHHHTYQNCSFIAARCRCRWPGEAGRASRNRCMNLATVDDCSPSIVPAQPLIFSSRAGGRTWGDAFARAAFFKFQICMIRQIRNPSRRPSRANPITVQ